MEVNYNNLDDKKVEFKRVFYDVLEKNISNFKKYRKDLLKRFLVESSIYIIGLQLLLVLLIGFGVFRLGYRGVELLVEIGKSFFSYANLYAELLSIIPIVILIIVCQNGNYRDFVKKIIFPELLKVFGENINYNYNGASKGDDIDLSLQDFNQTKLFKYKVNEEHRDESLGGEYNGINFVVAETSLNYEPVKKESELGHFLFRGLAMRFDLPKSINNRVIILSKYGIHYIPKDFEKVSLEASDFSKKYNVFVKKNKKKSIQGQIEARYLLNTAFMNRFMNIQTSFRVHKIACSMNRSKLIIMLSTRRNLFEVNNIFQRIDDFSQYKHLYNEFASVLSFIDVLNLSSKTKL